MEMKSGDMTDLICYMACSTSRGAEIAGRGFLFLPKEIEMGSKTQKTEIIRHRKHLSNKVNTKTEQERVRANLIVLGKLEDKVRK